MKKSYLIPLVLSFFSVTVFLGCAGHTPQKEPLFTHIPPVKKIAVLPIDRASAKPGMEKATCLLSDTTFEPYDISPEAAEKVTNILQGMLEKDDTFKIIHEGVCIAFLSYVINTDIKAGQLKLIQSFGKELDTDTVLYGKLFQYEERIGSEYSVKKPASVAFTLHLIRVSDGAILWRYTFDDTQQPLTENLLNFSFYRKVGFRWLTAAQFAEFGLNEAINDLKKRLSK
jgi:hypothetical protein